MTCPDAVNLTVLKFLLFSKRKLVGISVIYTCGCGPNMTKKLKILKECPHSHVGIYPPICAFNINTEDRSVACMWW